MYDENGDGALDFEEYKIRQGKHTLLNFILKTISILSKEEILLVSNACVVDYHFQFSHWSLD